MSEVEALVIEQARAFVAMPRELSYSRVRYNKKVKFKAGQLAYYILPALRDYFEARSAYDAAHRGRLAIRARHPVAIVKKLTKKDLEDWVVSNLGRIGFTFFFKQKFWLVVMGENIIPVCQAFLEPLEEEEGTENDDNKEED